MNLIERFFEILNRYNTIGQDCEDMFDVVEKIKKVKIKKQDNVSKNAVIILGYSGNGKTTYAWKFLDENPDYSGISYDDISRYLYKHTGKKVTIDQLYSALASIIMDCYKNGKDMLFDGNFLNICNRMALCDFLHELGYNVNLVDITSQFDEVIVHRVDDEARAFFKRRFSPSYSKCYDMARKRVFDYYEYEKTKAFFPEQVELSAQYLGADYVFDFDDDLRKVGKIPAETK